MTWTSTSSIDGRRHRTVTARRTSTDKSKHSPSSEPASVEERPEGVLEVGRFGRPHGVRGQIHLRLSTDRAERAQQGARLWSGRWLEIVSSTPMPPSGEGHFVVGLAGFEDRNAAESLVNHTVWAEPVADSDAVWVHQVIGAQVVDTSGGRHGRCVAVVANPANDLLELDDGALVPVVFITAVVADGRGGYEVTVDPPAGLFELFADESPDEGPPEGP